MKRAAVVSIALLGCAMLAALAEACDGSADSAPPADASRDGSNDRRVPTAEEQDDAEPECLRGDASDLEPPPEFRDRKNPLPSTDGTASSGRTLFSSRCALCHGAEGRGDGREGPYDPAPANFTLRRREDAYLFWRMSKGGGFAPICSAMPAFEDLFSETMRWQLVVYIQRTFAPPADAGTDAPASD